MSGTLHNKRNAFRSFRTFGATSRYFRGGATSNFDEVIVPDSPDFPTGAQTWSCWVKPERLSAHNSGQDMMTKWGAQGSNELSAILFLSNSFGGGQPQFYISSNGSNVFNASSSVSLTVDTWHHIVGVFTPSTSMQIYVDGVLTGSNTTSIPSAVHDSPADFVIGWRDFSFVATFKGNIADCRIYDDALTPTQVSDLYNGLDLRNNLVGQWLINADDTVDHSTNSNNGKNIGQSFYSLDGPLPSNQLFGKYSRAFSGISEYIDCGNAVPLFPNLPYTVSTWVKVDPTFNDVGVICARGLNIANSTAYTRELFLFTHDTGNGQSTFAAQRGKSSGPFETLNTTNTFPRGVWYHVCATYDGSNLEIFVDGVSEGTIISTVAVTTTDKFYIAKSLGPVDYKINGNVADIRVYDSALTTAQISDLYNGTDVQTGLIGHWLRNTDDLLDYSSNNNHGAEGEIGSVFDINDGPKYI